MVVGGPNPQFALSLESGIVYPLVKDLAAAARLTGSAVLMVGAGGGGGAKLPSLSRNGNTGDTSKNGTALRKNMENQGEVFSEGDYAHHIVPSTHPRAEEARLILEKFGIRINDAANGVRLPFELHYGKGLHSTNGINKMTALLRVATTKQDALRILRRLARLEKAGELLP